MNTTSKDDALKLALPDRRTVTAAGDPEDYINSGWNDCLDAIREALAEQPAQQDMPKIGCVNHDCDKCKAQQQEIVELTAQRDFLADILTRTATATSTKTARFVDAL